MLTLGSAVGALICLLGCGVAYVTWVGGFLWWVLAKRAPPRLRRDTALAPPANRPIPQPEPGRPGSLLRRQQLDLRRSSFLVALLAGSGAWAQAQAISSNAAPALDAAKPTAPHSWTNGVEVYSTNTAMHRLATQMLAKARAGFANWGHESNGIFVPSGKRVEGERFRAYWQLLAEGHPARVKYVRFAEAKELVLFDEGSAPVLWLTVPNFTLPGAVIPFTCTASNQVVRREAIIPGYGQGRVWHMLGSWPPPAAAPPTSDTNLPSAGAAQPEAQSSDHKSDDDR